MPKKEPVFRTCHNCEYYDNEGFDCHHPSSEARDLYDATHGLTRCPWWSESRFYAMLQRMIEYTDPVKGGGTA